MINKGLNCKIGIMQGRIFPDQVDRLQVFPSHRWQAEFNQANRLGFDYIELLFDINQDSQNPLLNKKNLKKLIQVSKASNVGLHSICADYFTNTKLFGYADSDFRIKLDKLIVCASVLSINNIVIPFFDKSVIKTPSELEQFLSSNQDKFSLAQSKGISLNIESTLPAKEILTVLLATRSPAGVCYDVGNATALGHSVYDEIMLLDKFIRLVHIKDRKKNNGPNVQLGKGDVDFPDAFKALRSIQYKGRITLETTPGENPVKNAQQHLLKVREYLELLQ
jgi:L-ribulose-5-phosphate 3-epimerase